MTVGKHAEGKYGRLIKNLGDKRKVNPPGEPIPRIQAWCYLCSSPHRFSEPCWRWMGEQTTTKTCAECQRDFVPTPRQVKFCSGGCAYEAKLRRNRERDRKHG